MVGAIKRMGGGGLGTKKKELLSVYAAFGEGNYLPNPSFPVILRPNKNRFRRPLDLKWWGEPLRNKLIFMWLP